MDNVQINKIQILVFWLVRPRSCEDDNFFKRRRRLHLQCRTSTLKMGQQVSRKRLRQPRGLHAVRTWRSQSGSHALCSCWPASGRDVVQREVYRLLVNQELMTQGKEMSCFLSMSAVLFLLLAARVGTKSASPCAFPTPLCANEQYPLHRVSCVRAFLDNGKFMSIAETRAPIWTDVSSNMKHVSTYCTFLALIRLLLRCLWHWTLSTACCYKMVHSLCFVTEINGMEQLMAV
jgi:hypothetical protein